MKKIFILLFIFSIIMVYGVFAETKVVNYTVNYDGAYVESQFVIQTLKYEPYPVNAGEWFDLWVKVQNIGQNDAKNTQFKLITEYPFSSNEVIRNYGIVPGITSSYRNKQSGDADIQSNQIILKFRVKTADNSPEGESMIKLGATPDKNTNSGFTYNLPIEIGKTKTDFDLVMQDSTVQGTSFAIANIGDNAATAVTVSVPQQQGITIKGAKSSILGNLDKGDFTTVSFQITAKNLNEMKMQIAYTDSVGVRNLIEKNVSIDIPQNFLASPAGTARTSQSSTSKIIYIIVGVLIGIGAMFLYKKYKRFKQFRKI